MSLSIDNVKKCLSPWVTISRYTMPLTLDGLILRFFFATQHSTKPIYFTEKAVRDAETNLKYLKNTYEQPFSQETWMPKSYKTLKISL